MKETITVLTRAEGTDVKNARIEDAIDYISTELGHEFSHREIRGARRKHIDGETVTRYETTGAELTMCVDMPPDERLDDAESPGHAAAAAAKSGHLVHVSSDDVVPTHVVRGILTRGVTIHVIDAGLRITDSKTGGLSPAAERAIEAISQSDADTTTGEPLTGHRHKGGRPPLGCKVDAGMLRADDNYSKVRQTLFRVETDDITRATASRRIGCVEKTIDNALERRELYRLDSIQP